MEQGTKKDLLSLTQRLLAEKAILIDTIKSYVLTQRTLKNESKYKNRKSSLFSFEGKYPCEADEYYRSLYVEGYK